MKLTTNGIRKMKRIPSTGWHSKFKATCQSGTFRIVSLLMLALLTTQTVQAQAEDGKAEVYEGKSTTIYLGDAYQRTLRKSKVISYSWYSEAPSCVSVTSSTQNYARIQGNKGNTSCRVYFKCSYNLDGFYRTMHFYYTVTVKSTSVSVSNIILSHSSVSLTEGNTQQLTASVYPTNATNRNVSWSSSNTTVASVSSYGLVTAKTAGTATITCRATDGSGCAATCRITVEAPALPELVISDKEEWTAIPAVANVQYERTFYKGWNSVCLPFAINANLLGLQEAQIALLEDIETIGDQKYISYRTVDRVEAGTACLIYVPTEQRIQVTLKGVALTGQPNDKTPLQGAFTETVIGAGCYKLTSDGGSFAITKDDSAVCKPFRAYIKK